MDGKPAEWMSASGQVCSIGCCIRWGQGCGRWSSQAWRVVLNARGEWRTFLPTMSYPVPPGKPQLTTGALGNETEETTGQARAARPPTPRRKKQRVGPFGGLVVGADGGIKILIAFWHDFVKGGGQACGFSHNSQCNGGETWQGRKSPGWGLSLHARKEKPAFTHAALKIMVIKVVLKIMITQILLVIYIVNKCRNERAIKRQRAGETRMWATYISSSSSFWETSLITFLLRVGQEE